MSETTNWEQFESLSAEEQAKLFREKSFKEKGELLLRAHKPLELAQSLSQEELYLLTREMDVEERSEIIRYANLPQLFFLTDMECWKSDRIISRSFMGWLETLRRADDRVLFHWLVEMDYEAVITGFKKIVQVLKPEREYPIDEILGDTPYFTLDDVYYVAVQEEDLETVKRALEILFENNRGRYFALLEGIMAEIDEEIEEEAYTLRETRLSERGFPDQESAFRVYRPITRKEFDAFEKKDLTRKIAAAGANPSKLPNYPVLWTKEKFFLDEVLVTMRHENMEVIDQIHEEMTWLSNKVIAAQGIDLSSESNVRKGIHRVRCFVSLGLELLSGGDLRGAVKLMKEHWLETIFRSAVTELLTLRNCTEEVIRLDWKGPREAFLLFVNPPYEFILNGLLRPVPEFYDSSVSQEEYHLRDFKCTHDLETAKISLEQMEIIFRKLAETYPAFLTSSGKTKEAPEKEGNSLFVLLGSVFAASLLKKRSKTKLGLSEEDLKKFIGLAFHEKHLKEEVKKDFLENFHSTAELARMKTLWALVFEEIEEDLGGLDRSKSIDLKFVSSVYMA